MLPQGRSAPICVLKNWASKSQSNISGNWAAVSTAAAGNSRNCTTRLIQVNTGIFIRVMPGARMLKAPW
ncbi:MAG: hypothetical protein R2746_14665 [Acidimicrobiales bacterium]